MSHVVIIFKWQCYMSVMAAGEMQDVICDVLKNDLKPKFASANADLSWATAGGSLTRAGKLDWTLHGHYIKIVWYTSPVRKQGIYMTALDGHA